MTYVPQPQPGIMDIDPYVPGESKAQAAKIIKLAANENPLGTSPLAIQAYKDMAATLHRYPNGGATGLRRALGDFHHVDPARIVCGTGSDEIITLLCRAFAGQGDEVLYSEYGFLMYPIAALAAGANPVKAPEPQRTTDLSELLAAVTPRTKIVFITNPNNPTGAVLKTSDVKIFRQQLREDILLVIDSAYAEYATAPGYTDGADLVVEFDNVVMLRTFSKAYGLSGLRIGWSYSSSAVADVLNRIRGIFNVNSPAQACAIAALGDQDFIRRSVDNNTKMRLWMTEQLSVLGLKVYPSDGNFLLISFGKTETAEQALIFLKHKGILLRAMTAYGLADCLRMTIGLPEDMEAVSAALKEFQNV